MYHPAAALRAAGLKQTMLEDMSGLPQVLIDARTRRAASPGSPSQESPTPEPAPVATATELEIEAEQVLATVALTADTAPEPVDENQMSLF
jgi:hypothetical protein